METTQPRVKTWLRCFNTHNGLSAEKIIARLRNVHVEVIEQLPAELPDGPGILIFEAVTPELCQLIRTASRNGSERILAISAGREGLVGNAGWQLLQAGASDVLNWSSLSEPEKVIASHLRRWQEVDLLLDSAMARNQLVGESPAWKTVLRQVVEAARFTDSPILLMGETGTGKELVARLIHDLDPQRSENPLITVDCTTIVPELSGSELFGHEKGAFTGAINARDGAFTLADEGTLFLDEVGELPLGLQVQLLRALQEHTYKRVGSNIWRSTDFRLICATNRDLLFEESNGRFRRDLYYRIALWTFKLPPLRERQIDILPLARHFMKQACPEDDIPELDEQVRSYLVSREYPGNVRDLRNLIFRIMSRHIGSGPITIGDIPDDERPNAVYNESGFEERFEQMIRQALSRGAGLRDLTNLMKETAIRVAVSDEQGNLQHAARVLGVTDRVLQLWKAEHVT